MATRPASSWQPDWAVPPGEVLLEALAERGMPQAELARRMNRPTKTVNEIIRGKAAITPETALQLERVLGVPASLWNNLERIYRERLARAEANSQLKREADWIDRFPVGEMVRREILSKAPKDEQLEQLLRFFGVSSPAAWERHWSNVAASFQQSLAYAASPEAVAVWLRLGDIQASRIESAPFDPQALEQSLPAIRPLTRREPIGFLTELVNRLKDCGVALVMTKELPSTHISGAARWLSGDKVVIQLSLRHRNDDTFWSALFHEAGHVLRGSKRQAYLDLATGTARLDEEEVVANQFAADQLIPEDQYRAIASATRLTAEYVERAAEECGVAPGIVLGRLQRDGRIGYGELNYLKRPYRWTDEFPA